MLTLARGVGNLIYDGSGIGSGPAYQVPLTHGAYGDLTGNLAWEVDASGTFTSLTVNLLGSLNNADWHQIATTSSLTGGLFNIVAFPIAYLMVQVTAYAGGTNLTVVVTLGNT